MRRNMIAGLACLIGLAGTASALRIAGPIIQPIPQHVMQSDTVIVGKVTGVEEKNTAAPRFKGDTQKGEYRVFTVKVESAIKGGAGLTHLKVGCLLPLAIQPVPPEQVDQPVRFKPALRPIRPFQQPPMLEKGQEVMLFLQPHFTEPFYLVNQMSDVTDSKAPNFKGDIELAKKVVKVLAEPMTSLKAKEASDRYLAAALLVTKYRTQMGLAKEEEVSAEESKLILEGLAAGNWNAPQLSRFDPLAPMQVFYMLQPQNAGYVQPQNLQEVQPAMKKWLEDNASKYRVKKFVAVVPAPK